MKLSGTVDHRLAEDLLRNVLPRQVPYVAASTLTALARDVQQGLQAKMPAVFDRPTDFTLRSFRVKPATKANISADVYVPESAPEDVAKKGGREYLRPVSLGAYARQQKKTEFLLTRAGLLPVGWVTTPGKGAQLDQHGNIPGSVYKQVINVLQLKAQVVGGRGVAERARKAATRLGVDALYFVVPPGKNKLGRGGGWLPPGVWKHLPGRRITQILKFVRAAKYSQKLNLPAIADDVITRELPKRWAESVVTIQARFAARDARG